MVKVILIFRGEKNEGRDAFCSSILGPVVTGIQGTNPVALKVTVTKEPPPSKGVIPFRSDLLACVSVTMEEADFPLTVPDARSPVGAYRVTEALPVAYDVTWDKGTPTPGAGLLTLFRKKVGLSEEEFIDRWHNGHTPLTLKLHPLWNYNRNAVTAVLTDGATPYDGIVEEHVRDSSDLTNTFRFFGPLPATPINMLKVWKDVRGFIEYSSIETYFVTEYVY